MAVSAASGAPASSQTTPSIWPVSYTHLDVYKRQAQNEAGGVADLAVSLAQLQAADVQPEAEPVPAAEEDAEPAASAEDDSKADVYKRQAPIWN